MYEIDAVTGAVVDADFRDTIKVLHVTELTDFNAGESINDPFTCLLIAKGPEPLIEKLRASNFQHL